MTGPNCVLISFFFLHFASVVSGQSNIGCKFPKHTNPNIKNGEEQIQKLVGKRYSATDVKYMYTIGICTSAVANPDAAGISPEAGIIQTSKDDSSTKIVGRYTQADIVAGPDWVLLEYNKGDPYGSHCTGANGSVPEERTARIMFICDRASKETQPVVLEEQNNKTDSCYYLFEFSTDLVCPDVPVITFGLSVGSILLIVFFSVLGVYLVAGCAYNRFVLGAKGIQQMPNLSFWEDFGNLEAETVLYAHLQMGAYYVIPHGRWAAIITSKPLAQFSPNFTKMLWIGLQRYTQDGCDLICRTRKSREPRSYKGIGDDQLQEVEERTDDHLLPM